MLQKYKLKNGKRNGTQIKHKAIYHKLFFIFTKGKTPPLNTYLHNEQQTSLEHPLIRFCK